MTLPDYVTITSPIPTDVLVDKSPARICRNCRFWGVSWTWRDDERRICKRLAAKIQEGYGAVTIGEGEISNTALAFPPDFGCIHFEAKIGTD